MNCSCLSSRGRPLAILDVGTVVLLPLKFWEPLLTLYVGSFHRTGVDMQRIDRLARMVDRRGW